MKTCFIKNDSCSIILQKERYIDFKVLHLKQQYIQYRLYCIYNEGNNKRLTKVEKIVKKEVENQPALGKLQPSGKALAASLPSSSNPTDHEIVEASYAFINIKGK